MPFDFQVINFGFYTVTFQECFLLNKIRVARLCNPVFTYVERHPDFQEILFFYNFYLMMVAVFFYGKNIDA